MKQHLTKDGPKPCHADQRPCPIGGPEIHFENFEKANEAFQNSLAKEYGKTNTLRKTVGSASTAPKQLNIDATLLRYTQVGNANIDRPNEMKEAREILQNVAASIREGELIEGERLVLLSRFNDSYQDGGEAITKKINKGFQENGLGLKLEPLGRDYLIQELNGRPSLGRRLAVNEDALATESPEEKRIAKDFIEEDFKMNGRIPLNSITNRRSGLRLYMQRGLFKNSYIIDTPKSIPFPPSRKFNNFDDAYKALKGGADYENNGKEIKDPRESWLNDEYWNN